MTTTSARHAEAEIQGAYTCQVCEFSGSGDDGEDTRRLKFLACDECNGVFCSSDCHAAAQGRA